MALAVKVGRLICIQAALQIPRAAFALQEIFIFPTLCFNIFVLPRYRADRAHVVLRISDVPLNNVLKATLLSFSRGVFLYFPPDSAPNLKRFLCNLQNFRHFETHLTVIAIKL